MIWGGHQRAANKCTTQGQGLHLDSKFAIRRTGKSQSFHGQVSESDGTGDTYTYFISIHTQKESQSHSEPDAGHKFIKMNEATSSTFDAWRLKTQAISLLPGIKALCFSPPSPQQ